MISFIFQNHFLFAIMICTTAVNNFFFCRSKLWKTKNTFCYFDLEDGETGTLRKNFGRHDVPALYPYSRTNDASTNGTDLYKYHFYSLTVGSGIGRVTAFLTKLSNGARSALFAIQYVNLNQQSGSSNLIGWKLEVGVATYFIQHDKG